jgi:hypothetical protein
MDAIAPALERRRVVLEGVPRLTFDPRPELEDDVELTPMPSAVSACLRFLGDDVKYRYLMGMIGDAFRLSWKDGWHPDNVADIFIAPASLPARTFPQWQPVPPTARNTNS